MKPLNPIMAALLAASSAAFALPGTASAQVTADGSCLAKIKDEPDPRNAMACLVATKPEALKDIGDRLVEWVSSKDSAGKQIYLTADLAKDAKVLPAVLKEVQDWPVKHKGEPGKVGILYLVLGPGSKDLPAWVKVAPKLADEMKPGPRKNAKGETLLPLNERLANAMAKAPGIKKITLNNAANATDAFLSRASTEAFKVFEVRNESKSGEREKVEAGNTTDVIAPTVSAGKNPLNMSGAGSSFDDMYGAPYAVVQNVWGANDDGYRTLSVKMYTVKVPKADGTEVLQNMIGIVDITAGDPNTPYKPTFIPMSQSGDSTVQLKDGGRKYSVSLKMVDGKHTVSLSRPGGPALETNVEELATKRADQAATGGIVNIPDPDGPKFYALAQGGQNGSVLFFPKDDVDNRATAKDPRYLRPVAMGNVSKLDADGMTVPMDGHPNVGVIDGAPYHLEFDFKTKMWKVMPGEGDKPKPADATKTDGATPAGQTDGTTGQPTTTPATPGSAGTLEQAVALAEKAGFKQGHSNDGFDGATKGKVRVVSTVKDGTRMFMLLFDPSLGVKVGDNVNQFPFTTNIGGKELKNVRGFKHYVVLEFPDMIQYFDYKDMAKYVMGTSITPMQVERALGMQSITDVDVAIDALDHMYAFKDPAAVKAIRERVAKHSKGEGYVISGNDQVLAMTHGPEGFNIWPKDFKQDDTGNNQGMTGLRGPGTVVQMTGGARTEYKDEMEMAGGRKIKLIAKQDHVALYKGPEDESLPNGQAKTSDLWYVMLDYTKNGNPARTKPIPVFGGQDRLAMPGKYEMQGLADVNLPDTAQLGLLHGSTQEKGAIVAYRTTIPDAQGGTNVKDKKGNCGGPILWWGEGITKAAAQKACETDSIIP